MQTQALRTARSSLSRSTWVKKVEFLPRTRCFNSSSTTSPTTTAPLPWFVDQPSASSSPKPGRASPPHLPVKKSQALPVPEDAPSILKLLHSELSKSPHLEQSELVVSQAVSPELGPALAPKKPQGRRKRGGIFDIETKYDAVAGGVWSWTVMTQVSDKLFLSFTSV